METSGVERVLPDGAGWRRSRLAVEDALLSCKALTGRLSMIRSSLALALNPGCRNAVDGDQRQAGLVGMGGQQAVLEALEARLALVGRGPWQAVAVHQSIRCLFPKC